MHAIVFIALIAFAASAEIGVQHQQHEHQPGQVSVPHVEDRKSVAEHVVQHIPQVVNHHIAHHKEQVPQVPVEKQVPGGLPHQVQTIAQQAQQHINQVMNHHVANNKQKVGGQQQQQVPGVVVPQVGQQVPVEKRVPGGMPQKVQKIAQQAQQHINQVVNHHIATQKQKVGQQQQQVPGVVVPQVGQQVPVEKRVPGGLPHHVQTIAQQAQQHINQVVNHHVANNKQKVGQQQQQVPGVVVPQVPQVGVQVPQVGHVGQQVPQVGQVGQQVGQQVPVVPVVPV